MCARDLRNLSHHYAGANGDRNRRAASCVDSGNVGHSSDLNRTRQRSTFHLAGRNYALRQPLPHSIGHFQQVHAVAVNQKHGESRSGFCLAPRNRSRTCDPMVNSAPNRRRSLVEEESTHVIVGRHGSYSAAWLGNWPGRSLRTKSALKPNIQAALKARDGISFGGSGANPTTPGCSSMNARI
jgi:hypothetical protein